MIVVGIDIGVTGAIAMVRSGDEPPVVTDMPIIVTKKGNKTRRHIDAARLAHVLGEWVDRGTTVFVERAQASTQMGSSSIFNYGEGYGMVQGALACLGATVRVVESHKWKRALGLGKARDFGGDGPRDKSSALELARKLYPALAESLKLKKHDGRAEALLIAHWGAEELGI